MNNSLKWKYLGTATRSNKINLPSDFSELNVEVSYSDKIFLFNFVKEKLSSTYKRYWNIYYSTSEYNAFATIFVNLSDIYIHNFSNNGSSVTSNANLKVWYR